jgi:uncharacterized membrane protein YphA (DoxX/SURF4 family)
MDMEIKSRWSLSKRIGFRFLFSYFLLFFLTGQEIAQIPFLGTLVEKYTGLWYAIAVWVGKNLFHIRHEIALDGQGSGDTTFRWLLLPCFLALAAAATLLWSVLDRKRADYERLNQWLRLMLRFSLAIAMITYGMAKVIPNQMASPHMGTLLQRVGDLSPMRMLWTFMGSSPAYETFTGLAELFGGVLLLVPRTTLLGALVCVADMTMVFMLNLCYDVPVKIMSFHYLVMAIILVAPDLRRLADMFLFNRAVAPARTPPRLFARPGLHRLDGAVQVLLCLFGLYSIVINIPAGMERYKQQNPPQPPLYGGWWTEELTIDGAEGLADPEGWRRVIFQNPGAMTIELTRGKRQPYALHLDTTVKRMTIEQVQVDAKGQPLLDAAGQPKKLPGWRADLSYAEPEAYILILEGTLNGRRLRARMRKMAAFSKEFHWIIDPEDE